MSQTTLPAAAAVVLAGGRSRRMGTDKALLRWGDGSLLEHVLGVLGTAVCGPLVVVGAAGSPRAVDHPRVIPVTDDAPGLGPLQGIATGLRAAAAQDSAVAFVCSVDLPLLHPAYVGAVLAALGDAEVALPVLHGHRQPLAAAYRTALGERATALLDAGARRPGDLFAASTVRELSAVDLLADPALRAVDPALDAVRDVDTPEEYAALVRGRPES
ncbi:molybdenum cofactor guanylyltransferase [Actinomycetospora endophytica]|uniref:Probable molybdenum cofactor guanylyltransferase n=1 Tax=Actinomycetospora endophytica TaxID=2291215 RepID=A0ABS8P566_9PSEU|nr:molybdenum cofactor guanylyltransferase [Actinomycetospora endophytica]MCD2193394.1 molybdenum cofactor guanylyltransferase [Actinomycetospora endophytica]